MNKKEINRLLKAKRRKGLKQYPYGFQVMIPQGDELPVEITFKGAFDRRKLRQMLRKVMSDADVHLTVHEADFLIDTFGTKLRRVTTDEMIELVAPDGEN